MTRNPIKYIRDKRREHRAKKLEKALAGQNQALDSSVSNTAAALFTLPNTPKASIFYQSNHSPPTAVNTHQCPMSSSAELFNKTDYIHIPPIRKSTVNWHHQLFAPSASSPNSIVDAPKCADDKLDKLNMQVEESKSVAHNAVTKFTERQQQLEQLDNRTVNLNENARSFEQCGRELQRQHYWRNKSFGVAMLVIIGIVALIAFFGHDKIGWSSSEQKEQYALTLAR